MGFVERLHLAFTAWQADKAPRLGASLAYYALFSIAPLLVVATGVAGLFLQDAHARSIVIKFGEDSLGPSGGDLTSQLLISISKQSGNVLAVTIGSAVALVGGLGIFIQLRDALDTVWQKSASARSIKKTIGEYLSSFVLLLLIGILLLASLAISSLLAEISRILHILPLAAWQLLDLVVALGSAVLLFALLLRTASSHRPRWKFVWPAAFLTAALFGVGRLILGIYFRHSGISSAYGAAGSLAAVLLWLYYTAQIILFGAEYLFILERAAEKPSVLSKRIFLLGAIAIAQRLLRRR